MRKKQQQQMKLKRLQFSKFASYSVEEEEVGRNTRLRLVFLPTLLSCFSRFLRAL